MLKTNKSRVFLVAIVVFSMIAMYSFMPVAKATALTNAKDTISDSDISATGVTHTIMFTTSVALAEDDYFELTFADEFGNLLTGNITASPNNTVCDVTGQVLSCVASGVNAAGAQTITITDVTNPNTFGDYQVSIVSKDAGGRENESIDVVVYIIDDITMDARVDSILTFTIDGLAAAEVVNGITTTETSTATATPFGTIDNTASSTVGQELSVSTNADDGYTVTVQQSANLSSGGGSDIDSFQDGTPPAGALQPWASPMGTLDTEETYGHMGLTSEDNDLFGGADTFGDGLYDGFDGVNPVTVMYHNGPVNGTGEGLTQVAYTVEVSALQEAGDYSNSITYICTPQF